MQTVLGLGSNRGDRFSALHMAVQLLSPHLSNITHSFVYESPALLLMDSPKEWDVDFLNMAISGDTHLSPEELLLEIKSIEKKMGRGEGYPKWSPRNIDIDILFCGADAYQSDTLTIPHPLIHERAFVLLPLQDLGYANAVLQYDHSTKRMGRFA